MQPKYVRSFILVCDQFISTDDFHIEERRYVLCM